MERSTKRQKVGDWGSAPESNDYGGGTLKSLSRSITPPPRSRSRQQSSPPPALRVLGTGTVETPQNTKLSNENKNDTPQKKEGPTTIVKSPIQLTHIRDLPSSSGNNVDAVRLHDILGDPMIRECWQFNYLFDVDFVMSQFDEDVRQLVQVKIVHGSWKKEAPNRVRIDEACSRYPNVEAITAYMPEPFGTHHSKMMVLLRHDDLAQVIIHTANMIPGDWANMCQAVWQSPFLPLASTPSPQDEAHTVFGTGARFKRDLLAYLDFYGNNKTGRLVKQLAKHDFSAVRAALIASVPSKQKIGSMNSDKTTLWGWPALKDTIQQVPLQQTDQTANSPTAPHIVIQISSIASLGQTDKWLKEVLFASLCPTSALSSPKQSSPRAKYSIMFPTPDEIRRSLNGYSSGGSIHMKLQSAAQQKQLQYMRPYLSLWGGDSDDPPPGRSTGSTGPASNAKQPIVTREAGRRRAAPHIKTYIRFSDASTMDRIDWAMTTSANLSTQAWGAAANANGEVRICSWEIGVLVWPALLAVDDCGGQPGATSDARKTRAATMVPCFKTDVPSADDIQRTLRNESNHTASSTIVGFRMPYDLPLTPYRANDTPWCATASHSEPDWLGQTWDA